jgi:hypothetical protein
VNPPAVELDEAADGGQLGFLGPVAQMLEPHDLAAFLKEVLNRHGAACGQDPGSQQAKSIAGHRLIAGQTSPATWQGVATASTKHTNP